MRTFTLIALSLMTNTAFSAVAIKGLILPASYFPEANSEYIEDYYKPFPKPHYKLYMPVMRLEQDLTLQSGQKIDKDKYRMVDGCAKLDLVSYNKNTGYFKYRLTFEVKQLVDANVASSTKSIPIEGKTNFDSNHQERIFIEGQVSLANNKPVITNINSNNSGFSFEYGTRGENKLVLIPLRNIPITVLTSW